MDALQKAPIDVVADYLHRLWTHATEALQSKLGPELFDQLPIKLVLTVPAIWDHQAQELTRQAAEKAGLVSRINVDLELVSEPEAAARYVLSETLALKAGDAFVVCDAGGGTVDLISYKVESLKPLRLAMCAEATGDLYGAVFLDNAFERQVKAMISVDSYNNLTLRSKKKMLGDWEHGIKRNFKHNERAEKDWFVDIPGYVPGAPSMSPHSRASSSSGMLTPQLTGSTATSARPLSVASIRSASGGGGELGVIRLKTGHLNAIFGEVCPRIVDLVQVQVNAVRMATSAEPKAIFLVGGFGANKYLKEELQQTFVGIAIQQPKDAWSAICRGAVLKGISDETVTNHIAKYNYGISCRRPWVEGEHLENDKQWDANECAWKANNQMSWYIKRGENISKADPIRHPFYCTIVDRENLRSINTSIYFSALSPAPTRLSTDVMLLCKMTAQFDTSLFDELPEITNRYGETYKKLSYVVEMRVSSGSLDWSLDYEGMKKGRASIAIDYQSNNSGAR